MTSLLFYILHLLTATAHADTIPGLNDDRPVTQFYFKPGDTSSTLSGALTDIWNRAFNVIYLLLGVAAIVMLIYAGIQYITAGGAPDKVKKARQTIVNTVLGIVILGASYAIINFIISFANSSANSVNP